MIPNMPIYKTAIVGAGPAGYFTAQALQNSQTAPSKNEQVREKELSRTF